MSQSQGDVNAMFEYQDNYLGEYFDYVGSTGPDFLMRALVRNKLTSIDDHRFLRSEGWDRNYKVIQFWDKPNPPEDVCRLVDTWRSGVVSGCHQLYNSDGAADFIRQHYDPVFLEAYEYCYHPAMKADYFRYAYLFMEGGVYIDADEQMGILPPFSFEEENFIALSPMIREKEKNPSGKWTWLTMQDLTSAVARVNGPLCYFNNNCIIVSKRNDVLKLALMRATRNILLLKQNSATRNVHEVTGPTCLTFSTAVHLLHSACQGRKPVEVRVLARTDTFNSPLSTNAWCDYKSDERHWDHPKDQ